MTNLPITIASDNQVTARGNGLKFYQPSGKYNLPTFKTSLAYYEQFVRQFII